MVNVRLLSSKDWEGWKQFRLDALQDAPTSFASSFTEESSCTNGKFQEDLVKNAVFGAFIDDTLVACAGFYRLHGTKTQHRGVLWGMYTKPTYRRRGLASRLIEAVVAHAKDCVMQLHLTCVTTNITALHLYQKHGFTIYGTEPNALKIGDHFFDEHLLVLMF